MSTNPMCSTTSQTWGTKYEEQVDAKGHAQTEWKHENIRTVTPFPFWDASKTKNALWNSFQSGMKAPDKYGA